MAGMIGDGDCCDTTQIPSMLKSTAKIASATIKSRIAVTTADVVARPTPIALRSLCSPRRQPERPMIPPKVMDHPIWKIVDDPDRNRQVLSALPIFYGTNLMDRLKPAATALGLSQSALPGSQVVTVFSSPVSYTHLTLPTILRV